MKKYLKFLCVIAAILGMSLSGAFSPAGAALIPADIVWLVDVSGSMGDDIDEVKDRIVDFNDAMIAGGINAEYGLVTFGDSIAPNEQLFSPAITDFSTFQGQLNSVFSDYYGYLEQGSTAINVAFDGVTFRPGAKKNFILITDEDDDSSEADFLAADQSLTDEDALFNFIGDSNFGNTVDTYGFLADNHGGAAFDIYNFRSDPDTFFTNFIDTKVQEIKESVAPVPEPGTMLLLGAGLAGLAAARRRKKRE